jgi:hypothetical protein
VLHVAQWVLRTVDKLSRPPASQRVPHADLLGSLFLYHNTDLITSMKRTKLRLRQVHGAQAGEAGSPKRSPIVTFPNRVRLVMPPISRASQRTGTVRTYEPCLVRPASLVETWPLSWYLSHTKPGPRRLRCSKINVLSHALDAYPLCKSAKIVRSGSRLYNG